MARKLGIGHDDFAVVRESNNFYVDKTNFIREWWESNDKVTLITRPRRFGKTLNMSMLENFFSLQYAGRGDLFEGLSIWRSEQYRELQGTYPVIFLSFANVKEASYKEARKKIGYTIERLYNRHEFLMEGTFLNEKEKQFFKDVRADMEDYIATSSLGALSEYLSRYYGKKVIILLDEYDTPMHGYWDEMVSYTRGLFNSTFKTNSYLERAVMTGITRINKESIFYDLNNLKVVTTTSEKYSDCFGFTEEEVFAALDEFGLSGQKQKVKDWYDGFTFGDRGDIYNPWSVISFLSEKKAGAYWANTSSNSLVGKLIREGSRDVKESFETLLQGGSIAAEIDEQVVYSMLGDDEQALWSPAPCQRLSEGKKSGSCASESGEWEQDYELELTNFEVKAMFRKMIRKWFGGAAHGYNDGGKGAFRYG